MESTRRKMGTVAQTAVDPASIQSGIIGSCQVGTHQVRTLRLGRFRDLFGLEKRFSVESIFGFCLPTVLVYASIESIESIQSSLLWVDGSRCRVGHCGLW
jgi:hypothetical protein